MSDLIERQAALDAVHYYIESGYKCDIFQELTDLPSAEPERKTKWIPVSERLPENGQRVIAYSGRIVIVTFETGISKETREKMEKGEMENPIESVWCRSEGTTGVPRSKLYGKSDEWGNNERPYCWVDGAMLYFGQDIVAWMPLMEPYRGEHE